MSFRPYPVYKNSGVEWLGDVPEHWALHKLKYIARFFGGGTPSRENLTYWNGDIPWVSPKDMKVEHIAGAEESITTEGLQNSTTSLISPGAILIVVRSGILKHTIPVAINLVEVALNQDMKAIKFDHQKAISSFFLRWIQGFNSELLQEWLKQGATVESVEQEYLADTTIPMPCVSEQTQITRFLDHETARIDALIEEQQRLIELLKEKRQAVISHAVTKGLDPAVPMKDSGVEWLGEVPAHWHHNYKLGAMADTGRGGFVNGPFGSDLLSSELISEGVPIVYIRDVKPTGYLRKSTDCVSEGKARQLSVCRVTPGDVLVAKVGSPPGDACIYPDSEPAGIVTQDVVRIRVNPLVVDPEYLVFLLNSSAGREAVESISVESTRKRFSLGDYKQLKLPLPPLAEQAQIVRAISSRILEINTLLQSSTEAVLLIKERRSALISAAVTGKIDVRNWQLPAGPSLASSSIAAESARRHNSSTQGRRGSKQGVLDESCQS